MGILEFILYMSIVISVTLVILCWIASRGNTDDLQTENYILQLELEKARSLILKDEYKENNIKEEKDNV